MDEEKNLDNNHPDYIEQVFEFVIPQNQKTERIDQFISRSIINATRSKVQKAIEAGRVTVNEQVAKASRKTKPGDVIICKIMKPPPIELRPENIPLDILYEDEYLLVVNKPAGMCTHPGFGNRYGTLVNALLYHFGRRTAISLEIDEEDEETDEGMIYASDEVRPGIVHRLDKDTSGLLVVSKDPAIQTKLQMQFADRSISREYYTIAWGKFEQDSGRITGNIGRSLRNRQMFTVLKEGGKHAITDYVVLERYIFATLLKLKLQTGRTHQIRVHLSNAGNPVFGDQLYGGDKLLVNKYLPERRKLAERCLKMANRQMLHARHLKFIHPITKEELSFTSELPSDMQEILSEIRLYIE